MIDTTCSLTMLRVDPKRIPADLKSLSRWLCWRAVPDESRPTKPRKVPIAADGARTGSSTDSSTWGAFTLALETSARRGLGLGIALGNGLVGLDLDNCITADGDLLPWADELVSTISTYTEVSPSGLGVKLFAYASIDRSATRRWIRGGHEAGVELYHGGRYFAVTGQHWPGTPRAINDATPELVALLRRMQPQSERVGQPPNVAETINAGCRDNTLVSYAGALRRRGATEAMMLTAITAVNKEFCDPPLSERDVKRIARSVSRYAPTPATSARHLPDIRETAAAYRKQGPA